MSEQNLIVTRMDADPRDNDRVLVTLGKESGGEEQILNLHIAVVSQEGLRTALEVPPDMIARLRKADEFQQYYTRALNFIAVRQRSASEVRKRLRAKETPVEDIEPVIQRLQNAGYLDDTEFARMWVRDRTRINLRGPRLIRQELYQKGVAREIIEQVMVEHEEAEQEAAEEQRQVATLTSPNVEQDDPAEYEAEPQVEQALELARRKLGTYGKLDDQTFRRRMTAFLLRRGYGYDIAGKVLKRIRPAGGAEDEE